MTGILKEGLASGNNALQQTYLSARAICLQYMYDMHAALMK